MRRTERLFGLILAASLLHAGCRLGPDPQERPATAADLAEFFVSEPSGEEAPRLERWWEELGDPALPPLVEAALAANHDLRAAAARTLAAEGELRAAYGARWPQLDLGLNASRSKSSFVLPGSGRVAVRSTTYSGDLSVSWSADLFGKLARSQEASWSELLAAENRQRAVLHTLVASVVRSRVAIATLEWRVDLARATEASWRESLGLVERRYRNGLGDALDVALSRQSLATSEAAVSALESALRRAHHSLDVLLARAPGSGPAVAATLPDVPGPDRPPAGLPVQLLERRPDLQAAQEQLAAATARVGIALADLFPSLTLTASAGARSDTLSNFASSETLVYNAVAGLLAPVFSAGRLRARVDVARARAEEAAEIYAGAVLVAMREVEDALVREEGLRETEAALRVAATEARFGAEIALARYEQGTGGLLARLESQRRRFASEDALLVARGDLWNARVDLHLALGGDWGSPPEPETESSAPAESSTESTR